MINRLKKYVFESYLHHTPTVRCSPYLIVDSAGLIEGMIALNSVGQGGLAGTQAVAVLPVLCIVCRMGMHRSTHQQGRGQA